MGDRPRRVRGAGTAARTSSCSARSTPPTPSVTSPYVTQGRLDATLDFPFQDAARSYASQGGSAQKLASVFARRLQVHDRQGQRLRAGHLPRQPRHGPHRVLPEAGQPEGRPTPNCSPRTELANELMFLSRGNPVVYYGDEQGFTGSGGDKDARQTMFASKVADYLDDDEIGTDRTHASDAYDTSAPALPADRRPRRAPQGQPGPRRRRPDRALRGRRRRRLRLLPYGRAGPAAEYVVAFNNAGDGEGRSTFATGSADMTFRGIYGTSGTGRRGADKKITVTVPAALRRSSSRPPPARRPRRRADAHPAAPRPPAPPAPWNSAPTSPAAASSTASSSPPRPATARGRPSAPPTTPRTRSPRTIGADVPAGTALRYKAVVVGLAPGAPRAPPPPR